MDYISPINHAIEYIESNLTEPLDIESVAGAAGYSRFHFDRLFLATVGETPAGYVRKRRLSETARELVVSKKRILDIALDYQFQSQSAFTRAFRKLFGLSPGAYRRRGRLVRLCHRIVLKQPRLFRPDSDLSFAHASIVFAQQAPASFLRRTSDRVYLAWRWQSDIHPLFLPD